MVVKRAHTTGNIAPALRQLLAQVNAAYPSRSKASDGIWPSAAHSKASPNSDHEAGNALDITDNLGGMSITHGWLDPIRKDSRVKYVIHDGRIGDAAGWRTYTGTNPHKTHAHVSVHESKRRDARAWAMYVPKKEVPNVTTRNFAEATIVDFGDPTHRAALKQLAIKYQDKFVPGGIAVSIHAELGANLDAYIAYAKAHGLEMHSITDGDPTSMVVRSPGKAPVVNAEAVRLRTALISAYRSLGEVL